MKHIAYIYTTYIINVSATAGLSVYAAVTDDSERVSGLLM